MAPIRDVLVLLPSETGVEVCDLAALIEACDEDETVEQAIERAAIDSTLMFGDDRQMPEVMALVDRVRGANQATDVGAAYWNLTKAGTDNGE